MTQSDFFGTAKWVGVSERASDTFSVLRGHFLIERADRVTLNVLGLGFFKCYINGICVNPDTFLPLSSDFESGCDPIDEELSGHRVYVPSFDITPLVRAGDNVIAIHFGGGWDTHPSRTFGLPKAIYRIMAENEGKIAFFESDETCRIGGSFVESYQFVRYEKHDYRIEDAWKSLDFDDRAWKFATVCEGLDTEYCSTDCPADALIRTLEPKRIGNGAEGIVYDCGINTSGYPVLTLQAARGERVCIRFSEALAPNGTLDPTHMHKQEFSIVSGGACDRTVQPEFTWFGFRYFEVIGNATPIGVKEIHADISPSSSFTCDNETLNWIYRTFLHTMLTNMHTGHPSDCPHLERRGYTGDGQLTCHAVLTTLNAKSFYEKWLQDIADSQDKLTGHIQYTAPYLRSGGGPGGWGCAIIEVAYQLYCHYGDREILSRYYENMRRYLDYLDAHSEFELVTSDKDGEWCLGDWCGPNILYPELEILSHRQQVMLPAPMVNTYFMVKSLGRMCEIARVIGRDSDVREYEEKAALRKNAIRAAYFNTFDGNFIMNVQGANTYAVDLGLGNEKTYPNTVAYYKKLGHYDTGIFATDILTRILFERGDADLALDLLTNNGAQGFAHWKENGATTFHEYWDSNRSRSHNHPMFGAPVAYFFEYLLGIRQASGSAGYKSLVIAPQGVSRFDFMRGSMQTPHGNVSVEYKKQADGIHFSVHVPSGVRAQFQYNGRQIDLIGGKTASFTL